MHRPFTFSGHAFFSGHILSWYPSLFCLRRRYGGVVKGRNVTTNGLIDSFSKQSQGSAIPCPLSFRHWRRIEWWPRRWVWTSHQRHLFCSFCQSLEWAECKHNLACPWWWITWEWGHVVWVGALDSMHLQPIQTWDQTRGPMAGRPSTVANGWLIFLVIDPCLMGNKPIEMKTNDFYGYPELTIPHLYCVIDVYIEIAHASIHQTTNAFGQ